METRSFRWYTFVTAIFVTTLVISNIIAVKLIQVRLTPNLTLFLPAAVILFPIAYIFGDILTEVYGYARARKVIWTGFFCNLLAVGAIWAAGALPAAPFWNAGIYENSQAAEKAYSAILGFTPRLLAASFAAYLVGEFLNSFVLARLKVRTDGRWLWLRTISSTIIGQGADSAMFISLAFYGIFSGNDMQAAILSQWMVKVIYEAAATPITYWVISSLKRIEGIDFYDSDTDFNPLSFS